MRILHTSDWHAGKSLYKQDRMPDLEYALQQMLEIIEQDKVDLLLVAGDIYDTYHPPTRAMEGLNEFFLALHKQNIPAIVISGNHDSTHLWSSMKELLSLASIHVFDRVKLKNASWTSIIKGEPICVTPLPYPSERQLVRLMGESESVADQRRRYAEKVAGVMKLLSQSLNPDSVQILCAHLMLNGAEPTHSERSLSISDTFAVQPQQIPDVFDYVALGHIHKRQQVKGSPVPAWYCGTPYQIDFGEHDMEKGVHLVDFEPGKKAQIQFRQLKLKHALQLITCHEDELPEIYTRWQGTSDYLKLRVKVAAPRKGLSDELRQKLGKNLLGIEIQAPQKSDTTPKYQSLKLDAPLEVYRTYCTAQNLPLNEELEKTFSELWEAVQK